MWWWLTVECVHLDTRARRVVWGSFTCGHFTLHRCHEGLLCFYDWDKKKNITFIYYWSEIMDQNLQSTSRIVSYLPHFLSLMTSLVWRASHLRRKRMLVHFYLRIQKIFAWSANIFCSGFVCCCTMLLVVLDIHTTES